VTIDIGTFMSIDGENPNLDKIRKISGTLRVDFVVSGDIKSP